MDPDRFKEGILNELKAMLQSGEIRREELLEALGLDVPVTQSAASHYEVPATAVPSKEVKSGVFIRVLYAIGAIIAFAGIAFFIGQVWDDIGVVVRIMLTLGLGLLMTISGVALHEEGTEKAMITYILQILGGLLIPGGAFVVLFELEDAGVFSIQSSWPFAITYGLVALFYALLRLHTRSSVLTFFEVVSGTAFIYLFTLAVLSRDVFFNQPNIIENLTATIGISYLLLAYGLSGREHPAFIGILNFFGVLGILLVGFIKLFDYGLWEILFLPLVAACLSYAVFMKSTSSLVVGSLFLMAYVVYITAEYFADSIGWPLALVLMGFCIIGLAYFSVQLKKRYIND